MKELDFKKQFSSIIEDVIDYLETGFTDRISKQYSGITLSKKDQIALIDNDIRGCTKCPLHLKRLNAVPGKGKLDGGIIFIGEGPGEMEDIKGEPFVGKAGQLLSGMLAAIRLKRDEVYITNVVKCRPPGNRTPLPEEINTCFPYLEKQIALINPSIICCLGGAAVRTLLGSDTGISKLRGKIHYYKNIPLISTYHPAAVLRFPDRYKRDTWNDLKMLRDFYKDLKK